MKLTVKTICNIIVGYLAIVGLVACSSSPAPWTQVDDSPWGAKRKAETESLPTDAKSMSDPILLGEPAAVVIENDVMAGAEIPEVANAQSELVTPVVTETVAVATESVVAAPATVESAAVESMVVESYSTEQELLTLPASDYAVQVYAANSTASVDRFKNAKDVHELKTVATSRSGSIVYVLVDIYSDRAMANAAAKELAIRTGAKPWVRSLAGLQKIIVQ